MKRALRVLRNLTVTYSRLDLLVVSLVAATITGWVAAAGAGFSARALVACEATFFAYYLVGSLVASVRPLTDGILFDLPLRLLAGYSVVNTALLVLAWTSPFGIVVNFALLFVVAGLVSFAAGKRWRRPADLAGVCAVALCLVASSLWCQDSIRPTTDLGSQVIFKPWVDSFYHAVHVKIFSASHGAASIQDFRMSGVPARPYHYGIYLMPAFIKQASGIQSYPAFAGVLSPVGVFFTGLAAYAFFGSLWGAWSGLAAAAALLLLPDGAQQGMRNTFMSYHWLTQISPSATYGLALLAVAWLFVIKGCTQGNRMQLVAGWAAAIIVSVYKVHFVLASALLLLLVPAIFFRSHLRPLKRLLLALAACGVYALCLVVAQRVPGVPLIRFDGSAVGEILRLIQTFAMPGVIREYVVQHTGAHLSNTSNLVFGVPYVLLAILGVGVPLLAVLVPLLRSRTERLYVLFPVLLIANFLIMFFGLALDFESSTPDELSHRPLLIVYFFVVSWVGGALGLLLVESPRFGRLVPRVVIGLATVLLVVPAVFGSGVQVMWAMPRFSPARLPSSLVRVAEYIRTHGESDDVIQDSQFDRNYVFSALSERRDFVAHTMTLMPYRSEMVDIRSAAINRLMGLRQAELIVGTARALNIRWFVLERGDQIEWPPVIASHPVLEDGPFTLYEF
ncbi:MAG: hypothetical protein ABIQ16_28310 [Polyangiaceae bacterium]